MGVLVCISEKKQMMNEYLSVGRVRVSGEKQIDDEGLLHAGSHYFPFEFKLPPHLPSSFKGKHGRLRYFVRLSVYSHGIFSQGTPQTERTSKFAVLGALDLTKEPDAAVSHLFYLKLIEN